MPNYLGDSENYVMGNPMQTPAAIVPEWYLLTFYAILRSIPNKLLGVIFMLVAILIILILPVIDFSKYKGSQFRTFGLLTNVLVFIVFFFLMFLGSKHVEDPYINIGQIAAVIYFLYFIYLVPIFSIVDNFFMYLNTFFIKRS